MKFVRKIVLIIKSEGAEWIYDTDDDNEPLRQSLPLQNQLVEMKVNQEQTTFNIYKQVTQTHETTASSKSRISMRIGCTLVISKIPRTNWVNHAYLTRALWVN